MLAQSVTGATDDAIGVAYRCYANFHMLRLERRQLAPPMMAMFRDDPAPASHSGRREHVLGPIFGLAMLLQLHDQILVRISAEYRAKKQFGNRLDGYAVTMLATAYRM